MAKRVIVSAPGKLMLFGEHGVVYGHPCIVTAVDWRMRVAVEQREDKNLVLNAGQIGLYRYIRKIDQVGKGKIPKQAQFTEKLVANFYKKHKLNCGLEVNTDCQFSDKFGFGSSAAVTVALAYALFKLYRIEVTKQELFELAYKTVLGVQGVGSGFDVAAAIWGGTIYYIKGEKRVEQIYCDDYPLIVGYTGVKANTPKLVRRVAIQRKKNLKKTGETFTQIERLVKTAKLALKNKDYRRLGKLMNANQERLIDLGVSSRKIEKLIKVCIECGAWGAKLSGAGGGDCIIGLAENNRRSQIEEKINLAGGEVIQVKHSAEGVRLETETR